MPKLISHAEMIAAVKREIQAEIECGYDAEPETARTLAAMRAVLAHLERTQPTDTQADLTERARGLGMTVAGDWIANSADRNDYRGLAAFVQKHAIAALQSDREAAAAEARRAAIEECAQWHRNQYREEHGPEYGLASEAERKAWRNDNQWHLSCADAIEELASPAPQEETR